MNNEELIAHFKERADDIAKTMSILSGIEYPTSALAQLICAISYDVVIMAQHQLEKESEK